MPTPSGDKPTVVLIMGPTASGKTDAAITLSQAFPVRLISVDSALVYRGMDIGTAKPSPEELASAPHQLIDIREPYDAYSVADFIADAQQQVAIAHDAGEISVLVGGTMLYHKALLEGIAELPSADPAFREHCDRRISEDGIQALHRELATIDPVAANRIDSNDTQRIIRALDVYQQTGQALTTLQQTQPPAIAEQWHTSVVQLLPDPRKQLHEHIAKRFHQMVADGFETEVRTLLDHPLISRETPAMKSVGYRQMADYLLGDIDKNDMIEKGIIATRQFAKRQFTWLRQLPADIKINPYTDDVAQQLQQHIRQSFPNY